MVLWFVGVDFTNNKREESGPAGPGRELSAHLDTSSSTIPSSVPPQLLPSATAAAGVASATAIPSAASMTSAGATSASSVHVPVSVLGAGSAAASVPEEMVSTMCASAALWKPRRHVCLVTVSVGIWLLVLHLFVSVIVVLRIWPGPAASPQRCKGDMENREENVSVTLGQHTRVQNRKWLKL